MNIRGYSPADGASVIGLWNACLPPDLLDTWNFYKRIICDKNFDPELFLLAEEDSKEDSNGGKELCGFAYATRRKVPDEMAGLQPEQGWIVSMGVHPNKRRRGIGKALLIKAEESLAKLGVKKIDLGPYPDNYFFPGVDKEAYSDAVKFFESCGYSERHESVSMDMSLRGYEYSPKHFEKKIKLEKDGYNFGPFRLEDSESAFTLLRTHFPHWLNNVRDSILAGRAENTVVLARNSKNEVVGFAMRAMDGTDERFGPFGVDPSLQGLGVGGILFHELVSGMVARRIFYTYFLWTTGRNLDIYGSWGMKVYRKYSMMGRTL